MHVVAVVGEPESLCDVDEAGIEFGELSIVRNIDRVRLSNVEAAEVADEGVGNDDCLGLCDTLGAQRQAAKLWQVDEFKGADRLERHHAKGAQKLQAVKLQRSADRVDGAARDANKLGGIADGEVLLELLGTLDLQAAGKVLVDDDVGIDDVALNDRGGLSDSDFFRACRGTCCKGVAVRKHGEAHGQGLPGSWGGGGGN